MSNNSSMNRTGRRPVRNLRVYAAGLAVCLAQVCGTALSVTPAGTATNDITLLYRAEHGDTPSQNNLGVCYLAGTGVRQDLAEAIKWFRKAAEQGDAKAQLNLGSCYLTGNGVPLNKVEAARWFRLAAERGDAKAQFNLGVCCRKGEGVSADPREAALWFRKAAEQGLPAAQFNLGMCYLGGTGVLEDSSAAFTWFLLAGASGNAQAEAACAELAKTMTPAQVAEAHERAQQWLDAFARAHSAKK